jgi:Trypsin-like peptidase domain
MTGIASFQLRRRRGRLAVLVLLASAVGLLPSGSRAAPNLSPGLFQEVSTGVALIRTFSCSGRPIALGSGFLVGESVVMTARHVLKGACRAKVRVDGQTFAATRWVSWYASGSTPSVADLSTIKLNGPAIDGYLFRVRSSLPPPGTNLSMVGYPLGNRLSLNQGRLLIRGRTKGTPWIAVKMLGAEGASGSAIIDDQGRVVGILQVGLGSKDILGQRTSGVLLGLDLVRWWGPRARLDLCRAYPHGGIVGCSGASNPPAPPAPEPPSPPPPPPPPPPPLAQPHIEQCWPQYTGGSTSGWTPASAQATFAGSDILTRGPSNFAEIARLAEAPSLDINGGITLTLIEPNGLVFATSAFASWHAGQEMGAFDFKWAWSDSSLFFQHPEFSGWGLWTFRWTGPDGLTCSNQIVVT